MEKRPKINITLSPSDKFAELLCLSLLLLLWAGTIGFYNKLPHEIPVHFNAAMEPDRYGKKVSIFALPAIATFLYLGLTILNRFPHIYNYNVNVTPQNARALYTAATRYLRWVKLIVVAIFCAIVFITFRTSINASGGVGGWFIPLAAGLLSAPLLFFIFSSSASRKTPSK